MLPRLGLNRCLVESLWTNSIKNNGENNILFYEIWMDGSIPCSGDNPLYLIEDLLQCRIFHLNLSSGRIEVKYFFTHSIMLWHSERGLLRTQTTYFVLLVKYKTLNPYKGWILTGQRLKILNCNCNSYMFKYLIIKQESFKSFNLLKSK